MNWAPPDYILEAANDALNNNIMANHYSYVVLCLRWFKNERDRVWGC